MPDWREAQELLTAMTWGGLGPAGMRLRVPRHQGFIDRVQAESVGRTPRFRFERRTVDGGFFTYSGLPCNESLPPDGEGQDRGDGAAGFAPTRTLPLQGEGIHTARPCQPHGVRS
jgi:hypothetical protein